MRKLIFCLFHGTALAFFVLNQPAIAVAALLTPCVLSLSYAKERRGRA